MDSWSYSDKLNLMSGCCVYGCDMLMLLHNTLTFTSSHNKVINKWVSSSLIWAQVGRALEVVDRVCYQLTFIILYTQCTFSVDQQDIAKLQMHQSSIVQPVIKCNLFKWSVNLSHACFKKNLLTSYIISS